MAILNEKTFLTFDDVLINPKFSTVKSRKDVDLSVVINKKLQISLPIISANMDTITEEEMAISMYEAGGIGALHRFCSIEKNVEMFKYCNLTGVDVFASIGLNDLDRFNQLWRAGCNFFILDVAHGAQSQVVDWYKKYKELHSDTFIVVGNFGSAASVNRFLFDLGYKPDGIKIGIGPGSVCETRVKTGVGVPQLSAIMDICDIFSNKFLIIADGGIKKPADAAKALAAGANMCMIGGMLAGTDEASGKVTLTSEGPKKKYRGSASSDSYKDQRKHQEYITSEGVSTLVDCKGSVLSVLKDLEGGIRSSMTLAGASSLEDFRNSVEFIRITSNGALENGAHINRK